MFEFLQEHYLAVGALCVCGVLESIEVFLEGEGAAGFTVKHFPYHSIGTAADLFYDLEAFGDVRVDFVVVGHLVLSICLIKINKSVTANKSNISQITCVKIDITLLESPSQEKP